MRRIFLPSCKAGFLFLAFTAALLFYTPCYAAIDEQGRQKLETLINEIIDDYRSAMAEQNKELVTEGDLLVETSGDYYAVTFPFLKIIQPDGTRVDIGMIAVNALPGDTPQEWKLTMAIPTPIIQYDNLDNTINLINIGSQNFMGVWHEHFRSFTKLNASYRNIEITNQAGEYAVEIPSVKITNNIEKDADGLWSGPSRFEINNINIMPGTRGGKAHIEQIVAEGRIDDYSIESMIDAEEKLDALEESYEADGAKSASSSHITGIYNLVFEEMSAALDGFSGSVRMRGFSMTEPPVAISPEGKLALEQASVSFGMNGFRTGSVTLSLGMNYDGLDFAPLPPEQSETLPETLNIDFKIKKLPFKQMVDLGRSSVKAAVNNPQAAQMTGIQALMVLPQLATNAGTNLTFEDLSISSDAYDVDFSGVINADHTAVKGFRGQGSMKISGLSRMIELNNKALRNDELSEEQRGRMQQAAMVFTMLKGMGKQQEGSDIYTYDFSLTKEGEAMLNGEVVSGLIGGGAPPSGEGMPQPSP